MLSKAKALYQVKLILDYLPEEEYSLIPKETIEYIENNFEYDENFLIDPKIPLEKQKIDDKAYEMLEKIIKATELTKDLWSGSTATCNKDHVKGSGETCTGSIFDNGMKIIYQ